MSSTSGWSMSSGLMVPLHSSQRLLRTGFLSGAWKSNEAELHSMLVTVRLGNNLGNSRLAFTLWRSCVLTSFALLPLLPLLCVKTTSILCIHYTHTHTHTNSEEETHFFFFKRNLRLMVAMVFFLKRKKPRRIECGWGRPFTHDKNNPTRNFFLLWELCVLITQPRSRALDVFWKWHMLPFGCSPATRFPYTGCTI